MTPNGVEIFNPLGHGIHGQPLMVPAHEYNRLLGLLDRARRRIELSDAVLAKIRDHWRSRAAPLGECGFEISTMAALICSISSGAEMCAIDAALARAPESRQASNPVAELPGAEGVSHGR